MAAAQQHFNAVSAGLSSNEDGAEATLAGQMMACKNDISKAQTEAKQVNINIKHYVITFFVFEKMLHIFALLKNNQISVKELILFCHFIAFTIMKF